MQSVIATPHTPHAMLMPDHGTTPIKRSTDSRTQAGDLFFDWSPDASISASEAPSRADRVMSSARGKKCVRKGARGVERSVAHAEPMVVSAVRRMVA